MALFKTCDANLERGFVHRKFQNNFYPKAASRKKDNNI